MVSPFLDWFHTFINSMHEWSAAQRRRSSSVWLSDWDSLVIDREVVLTQDKTLLAFGTLRTSSNAHQIWCFIRQEVAAIQNKSKSGSCGEVRGPKRWRVQGKTGKESWFCVFSARGPFGFMWWHSTSLTPHRLGAALPGRWSDLLPLIHPKPPQIKGMASLVEHDNCIKMCGECGARTEAYFMYIYKERLFMW